MIGALLLIEADYLDLNEQHNNKQLADVSLGELVAHTTIGLKDVVLSAVYRFTSMVQRDV
ncbi:hypothetical protein VIC_001385 [Vibrio coralliilyticus ATCC BAA-450]|nr:hypothetical protein VIC_001385 [Vibrio coralliilyticus ATCC BAA-450]